MSKKAGVLMPIASLPSRFGVGDFGRDSYTFIDILVQMQLKIWQVLPLNPLGYGNSPYQAYSSFAGDELYISLEKLLDDGLLAVADLYKFNQHKLRVDYQEVRKHKEPLLYKAFQNFNSDHILQTAYREFTANSDWLFNYAVFLTFKKANHQQQWTLWPAKYKQWIKTKQLDLAPYQEQIHYEQFIQFIFYRQWRKLKEYANAHGILIMGDIPVYLGLDSADVWENQELFLLDKQQNPTFVAGVPPDYFSITGQRWGNPLYNWKRLKATDFKFWIERLRGNCSAFDIVRIDHFRAFDTYWKIPASCPTAVMGQWVEAPGYALFDKILSTLPDINIVVEDLGDLREQVLQLRDHYKLKGMKVFQFIFDPAQNNAELENTKNTIIYSGTHDNSTLMGWYQMLNPEQQAGLNEYFNVTAAAIRQEIISYLLNCAAEIVIFPLQDIIGLNDKARINTPGQIGSPNWEWKLANYTELTRQIDFMHDEVVKSHRN